VTELWQLYDEDARPIVGKGATKQDVLSGGILHGSSHVWIWRKVDYVKEILVQRRAASKRTWPNLLDISAAGHIDVGEDPQQAAIRETKEEIGFDVQPEDLMPIGRHRTVLKMDSQNIENEFRWVYLLEFKDGMTFALQQSEVADVHWMTLESFRRAVLPGDGSFVPQGNDYFQLLIDAIEKL